MIKWSYKYKIGIRNVKLAYQMTKNVAIYEFCWGKFLIISKYACVKYLTNILSAA